MATYSSKFDKPWFLALILVAGILQVFATGCLIAGYSSLVVVFERMGFYHQLCSENVETTLLNGTIRSNTARICNAQLKALNLAYTIGFVGTALVKFPLGYVIDRYGPQMGDYIGW